MENNHTQTTPSGRPVERSSKIDNKVVQEAKEGRKRIIMPVLNAPGHKSAGTFLGPTPGIK